MKGYALEPIRFPIRQGEIESDVAALVRRRVRSWGGQVDTFERLRENLRRVEAGLPVILPMKPGDLQPG